MIFHFVIFSRLQSYDGGRETWLNMFLPLLKEQMPESDIHIYYFHDDKSDRNRLIKVHSDSNYMFHEIRLPKITNKFISMMRIFIFAKEVISQMHAIIKSGENQKNVLLGIGSFYEALVLMIYKILYNASNIKSIVWFRGIWAKETLARHSGIIHKSIVYLEKLFLKNADILIANGKDTAKYYQEIGYESIVIPNAVDLTKYLDIPPIQKAEKIVISYIGRLSKEKGILDFLQSIELFNKNYPDLQNVISFEIVGDGPLRDKVEKKQFKNMLFIGPINNEDMINYLKQITCGVTLTYSKSQLGGAGVSNGLLELMAAGRLIICWESPVFEQVLDQKSCFMVEESNVNALAATYKQIIDNFSENVQKSNHAKEIVKEYSKERHIQQFLELIA